MSAGPLWWVVSPLSHQGVGRALTILLRNAQPRDKKSLGTSFLTHSDNISTITLNKEDATMFFSSHSLAYLPIVSSKKLRYCFGQFGQPVLTVLPLLSLLPGTKSHHLLGGYNHYYNLGKEARSETKTKTLFNVTSWAVTVIFLAYFILFSSLTVHVSDT